MDFTKTADSLKKYGYTVSEFATAAEAAAYLDSQIDGKQVGFGGSMTLQEMGLIDRLASHNTVIWHWASGNAASAPENAQTAQIYLSSANAVAETGEIINIDGTCNRVSAISYGHEKVYLVVGENKIAPDFASALDRARNVAAPKNAQRLGRKTPCAVKGDRCYDCDSPERICKELAVFWRCPGGQKCEVVLIHQPLGY